MVILIPVHANNGSRVVVLKLCGGAVASSSARWPRLDETWPVVDVLPSRKYIGVVPVLQVAHRVLLNPHTNAV